MDESQRADMLLDIAGLGDNTPSQLMDSMLALLADKESCFPFKRIFLRQMPPDLRSHLISSKITDCRLLAKAADELHNPKTFAAHAVKKVFFPNKQSKLSLQELE